MRKYLVPFGVVLFFFFCVVVPTVFCCNEAVCGSVVSKCLLTKSCNCDFSTENCTCCKDCMNCLEHLYSECCSCVDMCPQQNNSINPLSGTSNVGDYDSRTVVPSLFKVLTENNETNWISFTFQNDINFKYSLHVKDFEFRKQDDPEVKILMPNCTVAFWDQCMSLKNCTKQCQSMGSSSYRWFHNGCCECNGQFCVKYGLDEPRCTACGKQIDDLDDLNGLPEENELDYGESEEDQFVD